MRIVGGQFKGRTIAAPKGPGTRPTSDKARESLFNIIDHADWVPPLEGARVMDIYAGSGALGLEAISRGASFCLFVETSSAARGAIRDNAELFQLFGNTRIHRRDATFLGTKPAGVGPPFDFAFMDPPYGYDLGPKTLRTLKEGGWLKPEALVILEVGSDEDPDTAGWTILDERKWGKAKVFFLKAE
ncbi:MAG: 16S rRNA (guanine(966)-N(2))-methyltransferase RsmD [Maricaulis sp.]|nr:16S rRNA (guanine(966)-N(2))-methyltransferase RsmD [Maricaulis sp.]HAQ34362.1 16S rRNA (guanine(966)-N(2))-methyltransferase RsmD [Alphaproteobacteria bacterium]